jgi:hypothetical protein
MCDSGGFLTLKYCCGNRTLTGYSCDNEINCVCHLERQWSTARPDIQGAALEELSPDQNTKKIEQKYCTPASSQLARSLDRSFNYNNSNIML